MNNVILEIPIDLQAFDRERLDSALWDEEETTEETGEKSREKSTLKTAENGTLEPESGQKKGQITTKWPEKWPEKVCQIIDVIEKDHTVTIAKLETQLGLGHTTLKKILREMQNENFIRRVGPDKGGIFNL